MATIKAGTYKFNDTLTFFESYFTTGVINFYFGTTSCVGITVYGGDAPSVVYNYDRGDSETVYNNGWVSTDYQTITVLNDTEITDTLFSDWFTDNTVLTNEEAQTPVAYIKYENFTRAILFSGQIATLPCAGKLMRDDVIVEIESDISGGTGEDSTPSLEGTAIPVGEPVERIYFNTNLTIDETNAYLSQLTYVQTDLSEYPIAIPFGGIEYATVSDIWAVMISKLDDGYNIDILRGMLGSENLSFVRIFSHARWVWDYQRNLTGNQDIEGTISSIRVSDQCTPLTDFQGLPIGLENEKIKNVMSITPFVAEGIVPVGELEITENGTFDVTDKASVTVNVESSGESGNTDLTELNELVGDGFPVIRAGTYRWKDPIDAFSSLPIGTSFPITFTVSPKFSLTADGFCPDGGEVSFKGVEILSGSDYGIDKVLTYWGSSNAYVYSNEYAWDTYYTYNSAIYSQWGYTVDDSAKGWGRTFTITEDTEVNDNIFAMFQASTERVSEDTVADAIESKVQSLITKANTTTDSNDTDLTTAVSRLIAEGGVQTVVKYGNFLTFSSPSEFTLSCKKYWDGIVEYSYNTVEWIEWTGATLTANRVVYLRGTGNTCISKNASWTLEGENILCAGNIENLLDYITVANGEHPTMSEWCFASMFSGCTGLIKAPDLPATTLANMCYQNMFSNCTNLISAPTLPAINLVDSCYKGMFHNCTSLNSAPALPATSLAEYCYANMFEECTNLMNTPVLPATTLARYCYAYMFEGCTNLTNAPALPAKILESNCYLRMFYGCAKLEQLPALPSFVLDESCYASMFAYCSSIKLSLSQTDEYKTVYTLPYAYDGINASNGFPNATNNMFKETGGTFTGTPSTETNYYTSNTVVLTV